MQRLTTSAALYFQHQLGATVPLEWFEMACYFFRDHNLPVNYFSAPGAEFPGDDVYGFAAHKAHLIEALQKGVVEALSLGSIREDTEDVENWRATATLELGNGLLYLGVDQEIVPCPASLLLRTYEVSKVGLDIRYGIGYRSLLAEAPAMYAVGAKVYSLSDVRRELEAGSERSCLDVWRDEMRAERRYLTGHFRGVYPASILSEAHIRRIDLSSLNLGTLSPLDAGLWLWELSDSEIPIADEVLDKAGALIK